MRKAYQKGTAVPGAQKVFDEFGVSAIDKRGRFIWEMPQPTSVVLHTKRSFRGKGKTKVVQVEKVKVPVYRGFDARLVRNMKSELRRKKRKDAERGVEGAQIIKIPDNLVEDVEDA